MKSYYDVIPYRRETNGWATQVLPRAAARLEADL
jgi:hypothetical protein